MDYTEFSDHIVGESKPHVVFYTVLKFMETLS
jgi:hypothetical protein